MDPNCCYERFLTARTKREKREAWEDLYDWLANGGFEPQWSERERAEFFEYGATVYEYA